jgi:hypothetical protein
MNASGTFQENHCYTCHSYLINASGCPIFRRSGSYNVPKLGKDPKFPHNLRSISVLSTTDKLFEKVILKIVQKHIEVRGLLNTSKFGFRARHSAKLQYMRLTDNATLDFNNNMSKAAVLLDIEKPLIQHCILVCYISYLN